MQSFGEWVAQRRKKLGYDRQQDLADAAELSLSTVHSIETTGKLEGRERGTIKLLAIALKLSVQDLWSVSKGEIEDAPIAGQEAPDELGRAFVRLVEQDARLVNETFVRLLSPQSAGLLLRMLVDRVVISGTYQRDDYGSSGMRMAGYPPEPEKK